jgi:hypothetical protein
VSGAEAMFAAVAGQDSYIAANLGAVCCGRVLGKDAVTVNMADCVWNQRLLLDVRLNGQQAYHGAEWMPPGKGRGQFAHRVRGLVHQMHEAVDAEFARLRPVPPQCFLLDHFPLLV